jgi:hypothetical protein
MHVLSNLIRLGVSYLFRLEVSNLFQLDVSNLFSRPIAIRVDELGTSPIFQHDLLAGTDDGR